MNILNEKLLKRTQKLIESNLYRELPFEEQERYEKLFKSNCEILSESIENYLDSNNRKAGVILKYEDSMDPQAKSFLIQDNIRGKIQINRGLIIHLYEMFYSLDYTIIVPDGKNIGNIKSMLFATAMNIIIAHELAHIYYGHLFLKNKLEIENNSSFNLDMQTLEWDADSFAITKLFEAINNYKDSDTELEKNLKFMILLGSIHGMMFLFRQVDEFDKQKTHPPCLIREIGMLMCARNLFKKKDEDIIKITTFYENEFNRQFKIAEKENNAYMSKLIENKNVLHDININYDKRIKYLLKQFSLLPIERLDYTDYRDLSRNK